MQLRTLIIIALRLFTIYWLFESIQTFLFYIPVFASTHSSGAFPFYPYVSVMLIMFLVAGLLWFSAFRLSSHVAKGFDLQLNFVSINNADLYCFAFVFLGTFIGLSSIFSSIQSGYNFFALGLPLASDNPEKERYLWLFFWAMLSL